MKKHGKTRWVAWVAGLGLCTAGLAQGTAVDPEQDQTRDGQEVTSTVQTRTQTQTETSLQDAVPEGLDRNQVSSNAT